ncbi:MAG: hypothetical protein Ct9H300mP26_3260 [Acidimicrobiales bacterium]|nr:MAG: hypothetical protein Ct9H300mP26_3260 [Acidimicrobiales bacterium]
MGNFLMLDDWGTDEKEGWAWGLQWSDSSGVFPTHYRQFKDEWEATEGPGRLLKWTRRRPGSRRGEKDWLRSFTRRGPAPPVREVQLNDGSVLRYTWYPGLFISRHWQRLV